MNKQKQQKHHTLFLQKQVNKTIQTSRTSIYLVVWNPFSDTSNLPVRSAVCLVGGSAVGDFCAETPSNEPGIVRYDMPRILRTIDEFRIQPLDQ